ncbi:hypothetical protein E3N88_42409 [Mikania micrantha]|uniref:Uncharacterized protein n=1 Tax=Mikania micrantha TaxID=192012 RepID=A0A5N6LHV1_9ASTR|nr:hypothetical protein E3N88_42409 [Mikania micrantha]
MMMNRSSSKDSLIGAGGRNYNHNNNNHNAMTNGVLPHRRGMPFTRNNSAENYNASNTDLFSRNRTGFPASSPDESDLQARLARLSVGSAKPAKSVLDDLLSSSEGGKNDYDCFIHYGVIRVFFQDIATVGKIGCRILVSVSSSFPQFHYH